MQILPNFRFRNNWVKRSIHKVSHIPNKDGVGRSRIAGSVVQRLLIITGEAIFCDATVGHFMFRFSLF